MYKNEIVLGSKVKAGEKVFSLVKIKVWMWITNKILKARFSYSNWSLCL